MVKNHDDRLSPKDRVVGALPNGRTSWLIFMGVTNWDDPPSIHPLRQAASRKANTTNNKLQAQKLVGRLGDYVIVCVCVCVFFVCLAV